MITQPGDIMACWGTDWTSRGISAATWSPIAPKGLRLGPSHLAIMCQLSDRTPLWVESTTMCRHPCFIRGENARGVQAHHPEDRVKDYLEQGGRVVRYSLTPINTLTTLETHLLMKILINHFVCARVDYDLGGALISGTRVWQLLHSFPGADLDRLFCSELVSAVLQRLGRLNRANPTRHNPARLLRQAVRQGVYMNAGSVE
tara:strand:- start:6196 stop:6801 length:606 start_codon:yes stop_codon:yes gene_type:complete